MRSRRREAAAFSLFSFQDIITSVMGIIVLILLVMVLELARRQMEVPAVQHSLTRQQTSQALQSARQRIAELQAAVASGNWTELAGKSAADLQREQNDLARLIPQLEIDIASARARNRQLKAQRQQADAHLASRTADRTDLDRLLQEFKQATQALNKLTSSNALFFRAQPNTGRQPWLIQISGGQILAAPLGPTARPLNFAGSTEASRQRQLLAWAKAKSTRQVYFVLLVQPGGVAVAKGVERELRSAGFLLGIDLLGGQTAAIDPVDGAPTVAAEEGLQ